MPVVRFHCPFVGLSGCQDGGGNGLTRTSLITHLRDRHCSGEAQVITRHSLVSDLAIFERAELTLKRMGLWLCGVCFRTHTLRSKCRHGNGSDFVARPDGGDGVVRFILYDLAKPQSVFKGVAYCQVHPPKCRLGFSRALKGALDKVICKPDDISCWVSLLALPICLLKTFRPRSNLECKSAIKRQSQEESIVKAIRSWGTSGGSFQLLRKTLAESSPAFLDVDDGDLNLGERNIKQCKRKICDGHYTVAVRVLSSSGVAPYSETTLEDLKTKHPFHPAPSLPHIPTDHHHLIASLTVVLDRIKSFSRGTSCGRDGLRAQHLMDCLSGAAVAVSNELVSSITQVVNLFLAGNCPQMLGEYIASAPLTPLVKPGGGIRPIVVGIVWRRLVSKVSAIMIGHSLDDYLDGLQFGVGVAGGSEAIIHSVNRFIEPYGDDVGHSMLLVDFKNAFNLVDREVMLREVHLRCPTISRWVEFCYSNPARLYYGEYTFLSCRECNRGVVTLVLCFFLLRVTSLICYTFICDMPPRFSSMLNAFLTWIFVLLERIISALVQDCSADLQGLSFSALSDDLVDFSKGGSIPLTWLRTVSLFYGSKPSCQHVQGVFAGVIYCDHVVSLCGLYGSWVGWGRDKPLRPADMLLYSWDKGLDVCVDLTGSSPLTRTGMVNFVPGRVVIDAAQHKRGKYMDKCAAIGYGFLPFSFSSLGELEADAVTLLKRIRKFSITQDIGARVAIHIFNRISFAIAKGVGAQIVSRLPSNFL
ncbi:hypothetical protein Tco_0630655 [Tanacetum coccineum]